MAASEVQWPDTADSVIDLFVDEYYKTLHEHPERVYMFYLDDSKHGRQGEDGIMRTATTLQEIDQKIRSLGYAGCATEISSVDSRQSSDDRVLVLVTEFLKGNDNLRLEFTQSFILARHDKGYYVLNDVLRIFYGLKHQDGNEGQDSNVESHPTPVQSNEKP
ncbi:hypothetical protein Tsubulata_005550 [Turnera subulata]|uniref:NTF2 domain-containing protein n=1 Tax=Turnera subulata TaxID=218843 RepID=A0A9Q0FZT0_9ROSI|nr:hypothetical protein Tsubulata_005550 [Turnera subulata]